MSGTTSRQKEIIHMAESEGLVVERVVMSKSIKLYVRAPDGRKRMMTAPITPSCPRGDANMKAEFRRFSRGPKIT